MSSEGVDGGEIEIPVEESGHLELYHKGKWKKYLFFISGGALYYKSKEKDTSVKGIFKLKCAKIVPSKYQKNFSWGIEIGTDTHYFAASDNDECNKWKSLIERGLNKEPGEVGKLKQTKMMALKKSMAGNVATSTAGKSILKDLMGPDGYALISQVKAVITLVQDKKKAKEIEENVIKITTKIFLLYQNKNITYNELSTQSSLSREIWSNMLDYLEMPFALDILKLQTGYQKIKKAYMSILKPYLTEKNLERINYTIDYLSTESFLNFFFNDPRPEMEEHREKIAKSLRALWTKTFGSASK